MILNIEEMSLLLEVEHSSRKTAIRELAALLSLVEDAELRSQLRKLGGRLYAMSDEEFAAIDFAAWEEDLKERS